MSYTRPDYNAADVTWEGASEYTRPAYDAADAAFAQESQIEVGVTNFALEAQTPVLPLQPGAASAVLAAFGPSLLAPISVGVVELSLTAQPPVLPVQPDTALFAFAPGVPILPLQPPAADFHLHAQTPNFTDETVPVEPSAANLTVAVFTPTVDAVQPPVAAFSLGAPAFSWPLQPESASFGLATFSPRLDGIYVTTTIEFRHAPLVPWVMPMTSPVYPPAASVALSPHVPGVSIRGLWAPPDMIFGWSYDSGTDTISIPLSSLFELTAGQADPATGDWRAVVLALLNTMWDAYIELDDPPQAIQLSYSPGYEVSVGPMARTVKTEYTAVTYLTFPEKYLADEP